MLNDGPGTRAKQFTGDLVFGKTVTLRVHDIDRYGRQVAEIILPDGRNVNYEIVKARFAWWFVRYARHDEELQRLELEAREARRGLWADENPVAPWEFRRSKAAERRLLKTDSRMKSTAPPCGDQEPRPSISPCEHPI